MESLLSPVAATVVVSFGLTARALGAERFTFWLSHSRWRAFLGGLLTFLVLCVASASGVITGRAVLGQEATFFTDLAAAGISQSTLRNMRSKDPSVTLALGFLVEVFTWTETWVNNAIHDWAKTLGDDALVDATACLDDAKDGPATPSGIAARAEWRQDFVRLLASGGEIRKAARQSLEQMIRIGYPTYRVRRPR